MFAIGVGVGIAIDRATRSTDPSAAQIAEQRRIGAAQLAEQERKIDARARLRADRLQKLAAQQRVLAERQATQAVQLNEWLVECNRLYPEPSNVGGANSALHAGCVNAARKGIAPETFRPRSAP